MGDERVPNSHHWAMYLLHPLHSVVQQIYSLVQLTLIAQSVGKVFYRRVVPGCSSPIRLLHTVAGAYCLLGSSWYSGSGHSLRLKRHRLTAHGST